MDIGPWAQFGFAAVVAGALLTLVISIVKQLVNYLITKETDSKQQQEAIIDKLMRVIDNNTTVQGNNVTVQKEIAIILSKLTKTTENQEELIKPIISMISAIKGDTTKIVDFIETKHVK